MSRSYEEWQELILGALGDGTMTGRQLSDAINDAYKQEHGEEDWDVLDDLLVSPECLYPYLRRMIYSGVLSREPTGRYRPKWRYFKSERPLTGEFADIVGGVTLEAPE